MEETWAGMLPTHSRRDTAESAANTVRTVCANIKNPYISQLHAMYCMCSVSMCDCCICFRRINHMVLHYMHWSSVHMRERLAVVSQTRISIKQPKRWRRSVGMNKGGSCIKQECCSSMRGSTLATAGNSMGGREPVGGYIWQVQCKTMVPGPGKVATGQLIWWEAKHFCHNFSTTPHTSHPPPSNYIRVALRALSSFQGEIKWEFLLLTYLLTSYLLYFFREEKLLCKNKSWPIVFVRLSKKHSLNVHIYSTLRD